MSKKNNEDDYRIKLITVNIYCDSHEVEKTLIKRDTFMFTYANELRESEIDKEVFLRYNKIKCPKCNSCERIRIQYVFTHSKNLCD